MPTTAKTIGVALWGASGRMGKELQDLMKPDSGWALKQAVSSRDMDLLSDGLESFEWAEGVQLVVDFSSPQGLERLLGVLKEKPIPVVSGTTGIQEEDREAMIVQSRRSPVFWAPNFSLGIAALGKAIKALESLLGGFGVSVVETHHIHKKDAPSGTALRLKALLEESRGEEVPAHSLRGGSNPGRHDVIWMGQGEEIHLSHQAFGREVFARGALEAGRFLLGCAPGFYVMEDLLLHLAESAGEH